MKKERFKIAGTSHYEENIKTLRFENSDFAMSKKELSDLNMADELIYRYFYDIAKVELRPEPNNQYDPNAIAVYADEVKVGYIKKGSTAHVRNLLNSPDFDHITAEIYGGEYKVLLEDDEGHTSIESGEAPISMSVYIYTGEDEPEPTQAVAFDPEPEPKKNHRLAVMIFGILFVLIGLFFVIADITGIPFIILGVILIAYAKVKK